MHSVKGGYLYELRPDGEYGETVYPKVPEMALPAQLAKQMAKNRHYGSQLLESWARDRCSAAAAIEASGHFRQWTSIVGVAQDAGKGWWPRVATVAKLIPTEERQKLASVLLNSSPSKWVLPMLEWALAHRNPEDDHHQFMSVIQNYAAAAIAGSRAEQVKVLKRVLEQRDDARVRSGVLLILAKASTGSKRDFNAAADFFRSHGHDIAQIPFRFEKDARFTADGRSSWRPFCHAPYCNMDLVSIMQRVPALMEAAGEERRQDLLLAILSYNNHGKATWARLATQLLDEGVRLDAARVKTLYTIHAGQGQAYEALIDSIDPRRKSPRP